MKAHAPGSVTTVFAPQPNRPKEGSLGVSFTIEDGIVAEIEDSPETAVFLDAEPTSFEPVEIALRDLNVTAEVSLTSEIPVGYGFGASGSATLATVLAANDAFGLERTRDELVETAHRAEIEAGTGLGDVFVQSLGGLVWNSGDGIERTERTDHIEYTALSGMATADVLGDDNRVEQIGDAGREILNQLSLEMSIRKLLWLSWEFAQQTGLVTDQVDEEVARVERADGVASMAMLGETVIATGVHDVLENTTRVTTQGARLL